MRDVCIIGGGTSTWGEVWQESLRSLYVDAARKAIAAAGVDHIDAMYVGFNAGREFTTADILEAIKRQVPLSVSQREVVQMLRDWLREGRAQSASFSETREAERQFVPLQIRSGS